MVSSALKLASSIADLSPVAIQGTKVNLNYARDHSVEDGLDFVVSFHSLARFIFPSVVKEIWGASMSQRECRMLCEEMLCVVRKFMQTCLAKRSLVGWKRQVLLGLVDESGDDITWQKMCCLEKCWPTPKTKLFAQMQAMQKEKREEFLFFRVNDISPTLCMTFLFLIGKPWRVLSFRPGGICQCFRVKTYSKQPWQWWLNPRRNPLFRSSK